MKITVLADNSGEILAATCTDPTQDTAGDTADNIAMTLQSSQCLHELDVPDELAKHIGCSSFTQEIFCYNVKTINGTSQLVRQQTN